VKFKGKRKSPLATGLRGEGTGKGQPSGKSERKKEGKGSAEVKPKGVTSDRETGKTPGRGLVNGRTKRFEGKKKGEHSPHKKKAPVSEKGGPDPF